MSKKNLLITTITPHSSKQEEIDALKELRDTVPQDTYLGSLLSEELLDYFTQRVHCDYATDLCADYRHEAQQHWQSRQDWRQSQNARHAAENLAAEFQALYNRATEDRTILHDQYFAMRDRAQQAETLLGEESDTADSLRDENMRLKAKLYDLEHKHN